MTWAERFGDLATNVALVVINFGRIFTVVARAAADRVDGFVTSLAERSEGGVGRTRAAPRGWTNIFASVVFGVAAIVLRTLSVATVFLRQLTEMLDEFLRGLAEEGPGGGAPGTPTVGG